MTQLEIAATAGIAHAERGESIRTQPLPAPPSTALEAPVPIPPSRVIVHRVGIDLPIQRGDQSTIDQGIVTWYDDGVGGWPEPTFPGHVGTFWLAAHRTSQGGPFARLVEVGVGDRVDIALVDGSLVSYRIETANAVEANAGYPAIYGDDPTVVAIALQTSLPGNRRWVVRGSRI